MITTNGTLLKKRGEELISSGVYKVNISVHSFEDGEEQDFLSYIDSVCDFADKASSGGILTVLRLWNNGHDGGKNQRIEGLLKAHFPEVSISVVADCCAGVTPDTHAAALKTMAMCQIEML